jgi:hypothetical protein
VLTKFVFKMLPVTAAPIEAAIIRVSVTVRIGVSVTIRINIRTVVGIVIAVRISVWIGWVRRSAKVYTKPHSRVRRTGAHQSQYRHQGEYRNACFLKELLHDVTLRRSNRLSIKLDEVDSLLVALRRW